jgi:hypothetical protein
VLREPLPPNDARRLARQVLERGTVSFSRHAREEMAKDGIDEQDVASVLRGGIAEPGELERGTWRYRLRVAELYVVVAFLSETDILVVTAWRK